MAKEPDERGKENELRRVIEDGLRRIAENDLRPIPPKDNPP
jgi:hypothetical protein